ncbi:siderophore-interacting protein [Vibrio sp. T187]|uniref:siderophore-interacting protein n=1 Tax=Vibrio TaxID=662 RepID=UPI0010C93B89|nr:MULTISPECIES: siderophore-interacting protein [Vibrio]MBW3695626.1 siderophore-interacting protein [Vibrio sp. T187]
MSKPTPLTLTVLSTTTITPNMQRIVFTGEGLKNFPTHCAGGYVKLLFTPSGSTDLSTLSSEEKPVMRTYTIRDFDLGKCQLEIDFVRHITKDLQCGFAARWAMNAQVGDTVSIAGPGLIQGLNLEADWFFLTADMTSLPALSAKLRSLPSNAVGHAIIHITSEQDKQALAAPEGLRVQWVVEGESEMTLAEAAREVEWLSGQVSVWCACEFDSMRQLRQYFRNEKEVEKNNIYISSYWKRGVTEDGHKVIKREDANLADA